MLFILLMGCSGEANPDLVKAAEQADCYAIGMCVDPMTTRTQLDANIRIHSDSHPVRLGSQKASFVWSAGSYCRLLESTFYATNLYRIDVAFVNVQDMNGRRIFEDVPLSVTYYSHEESPTRRRTWIDGSPNGTYSFRVFPFSENEHRPMILIGARPNTSSPIFP